MTRLIRLFSITLLGLLWQAAPSEATPANKRALADYLGPFAPAKAFDCRTCHVATAPTAEDHDHNSFGARLVQVRKELRKAGQPVDLPNRLERIADEDSDGDGVANLVELLTGHAPGDAADKPSATELKDIDALHARFRKYLTSYRWRPLEPVRRPAIPEVGELHPIDAFLEAARREHRLTARPDAPKHVLLRRVYLDLIGVPPGRTDVDAFLADTAPDAYERLVDRLLASPQYGERWGRHWMDVWRYSDWAGFGAEVRESLPHIWQWRDWIIESLNADIGYDRMVREMLAGDEITPDDPKTVRATGFLVRNSYIFNRNVVMDNTVEHTAKAFLGLTLNCARCHDHMYDPIAQTEYYSFRAIFEPCMARTDRVPGYPDIKTLGVPRIYDAKPDAKTFLFTRGNEATPDKDKVCSPAVPAALGGALDIKPVPLPRGVTRPDKQPFIIAETRAAARQGVLTAQETAKTAHVHLLRAAAASVGSMPPHVLATVGALPSAARNGELARLDVQLTQARFAALEAVLATEKYEDDGTLGSPEGQRAAEVAVVAQRQRALAQARRDLLAADIAVETAATKARPAAVAKVPAAKTALAKTDADAAAPLHANFTRRTQASYPDSSTGRRLALAKWLTDRQNPLAARAAVNHIWARHFGQPLVPTVFDFGRNGQPPSHPALLDWLAAEFMERGWGMKSLHRVIVTSRAYRMDSRSDPANAERDPDNKYLWRMMPRRMEAEVVRDSVLALSGQLDPKMGGPELDQNQGLTTFRRSVYYRHANEKQVPFLVIFDAASANECYRRPTSIVPQQALALANSPLTQQASQVLAKLLDTEAGPSADDAFVDAAFRQVLNRPPTAEEAHECARFLAERSSRHDAAPAKARASLVHVLLNHHDFVTIH